METFDTVLFTMKLMELLKMAKMMALIKRKTLIHFNADWKSLLNFSCETENCDI